MPIPVSVYTYLLSLLDRRADCSAAALGFGKNFARARGYIVASISPGSADPGYPCAHTFSPRRRVCRGSHAHLLNRFLFPARAPTGFTGAVFFFRGSVVTVRSAFRFSRGSPVPCVFTLYRSFMQNCHLLYLFHLLYVCISIKELN